MKTGWTDSLKPSSIHVRVKSCSRVPGPERKPTLLLLNLLTVGLFFQNPLYREAEEFGPSVVPQAASPEELYLTSIHSVAPCCLHLHFDLVYKV